MINTPFGCVKRDARSIKDQIKAPLSTLDATSKLRTKTEIRYYYRWQYPVWVPDLPKSEYCGPGTAFGKGCRAIITQLFKPDPATIVIPHKLAEQRPVSSIMLAEDQFWSFSTLWRTKSQLFMLCEPGSFGYLFLQ